MSNTSDLEALRNIELFRGIADAHLEKLAAISRRVEFRARTTIFREYEAAKDVYAIVSGEVSLAICAPKGVCRQIMVVRNGDLLGWSPLLGRPRLTDTAYTLTPVSAISFDRSELLNLCSSIPEFGFEFMRRVAEVLAQRLSATRVQLFELSGVRLPEVQVDTD